MAKLVEISRNPPAEYVLGDLVTIGRHPGNTIQILDRIVSKEHAQIFRSKDGRWVLRDLGSLNGTFVRGERIREHVLQDGDEIVMGSTRFVFREQGGAETTAGQVTIAAPDQVESHIRQKIDTEAARRFLPEKDIYDVEILRRDYERLRIAYEVGQFLGLEINLDTLLQKILDKTFDVIPADRGAILLMDQSSGQLEPAVIKRRKEGSSQEEEIVISRTILNEVVSNKVSVLTSDAQMDSRFMGAHSIILQGIRSTMCVPLLWHEELLGVIYLDSQVATGAFTEKDLQILTSIANQAAVAIQNARLAQKIEQETATRVQLERLLSPNLVDQIVSGKMRIEQGGELREVTILFADIRGFTSMSEQMPAQEIVSLLNDYFETMVEVIFRYDGTLDKYVGDEVMALFGAPVALPDGPSRAVECAVEMQRALRDFNRRRQAAGQAPVSIGIGVNTGLVVCGAIGTSKTMQYTAVGDAVNLASRLCSLAKPGEILISAETASKLDNRFQMQQLPKVKVKGKKEPVLIFNVLGLKSSREDLTTPIRHDGA